ncbi:TPA: phage head closure protein [Clostridioides difficile]|nr:phage head closure protein [Clostridioides difficile]
MNVGNLNKRITIQIKEQTNDENGFTVNEWIDFKTVWANIKNINGKEFFQAQQAQSKANKKITIRYLKYLDSSIDARVSLKYRVKYKENTYNILYSDNIQEKNQYIELLLEGE